MHQFYAPSDICRTNWVRYAAWVSFCHINFRQDCGLLQVWVKAHARLIRTRV